MSCSQPTGGTEAVTPDLPDAQRQVLRSPLTICFEGVSGDLKQSGQMPNPERAQWEADADRRLLAALDAGDVTLSDESARATVEAMAVAIEEGIDYARLVTEHDALFGQLDVVSDVKVSA